MFAAFAIATAWVGLGASTAHAASRVLVPNCGNPSYLETRRPSTWSNGCTGGAYNVVGLRWSRGGTGTSAAGRARLRLPCGTNPTCPEAGSYDTAARLVVSRPARCTDGPAAGERFYSRARLRIKYRRNNPFGVGAGWKTYRFRIDAYEGRCDYAP